MSSFVTHPSMSEDDVQAALDARGIVGIRPWLVASITDEGDCWAVTEWLPNERGYPTSRTITTRHDRRPT